MSPATLSVDVGCGEYTVISQVRKVCGVFEILCEQIVEAEAAVDRLNQVLNGPHEFAFPCALVNNAEFEAWLRWMRRTTAHERRASRKGLKARGFPRMTAKQFARFAQ